MPPYSPDLNPIDNAFSKIKAHLRKADKRTIADLWQAIADTLPKVTQIECSNYFANAGYASI